MYGTDRLILLTGRLVEEYAASEALFVFFRINRLRENATERCDLRKVDAFMFESRTSKINESMLNVLVLKNRVIANNIANVDTPRYKTQSVIFQEELRKRLAADDDRNVQLRRTHSKHLPTKSDFSTVPYKIIESTDTVVNNNLNNVDIDAEMANLAKNQLAYNVIVDRVSGHYKKYKQLLTDLT
ncbi:flagellar basal body rod protein FlgB [Paenibacillus sp.]|uniref:flagellar basal body rod protein FlgB n=1 Tax=Paenibacillus sp. TaxID=58172 RepID=UPI002811B191|nr:flagellar basal body rod protein FlgB [Paenibacillus sp.]